MDAITMSSIVQHGLIQRDCVFTVSVLLPDKPGELAKVADLLQKNRAISSSWSTTSLSASTEIAAVELRITMEAICTDHKKSDRYRLTRCGRRPKTCKGV